jgi:hypothetical protein
MNIYIEKERLFPVKREIFRLINIRVENVEIIVRFKENILNCSINFLNKNHPSKSIEYASISV